MEKYDICSYCVTFGKLSEEEAVAAGWYFGMSNLGMDGYPGGPGKLHEVIKECEGDWGKVKNEYKWFLESLMESDKMYDDCLGEVNHWIKLMIKGEDEYFLKEWEKRKNGSN
jgi:hypothetical protein